MILRKKYQLLYAVSFLLSLIILIHMYTLSSPLPIGWDTPIYVNNIDGITEHGSNWLTMNGRFVYKTNYFILGSVISSILGIDNLTLQIVYPILISSIILIILIVFAYEKGGYYKYTPVAAIFWISIYKLNETNATLLFILNLLLIFYILDKKRLNLKYWIILLLLLASFIMTHFIQVIFFIPLILVYAIQSKKISYQQIISMTTSIAIIVMPFIYINLDLIKQMVVKETTGSMMPALTPHNILLNYFGTTQFLFIIFGTLYLVMMCKKNRDMFLVIWVFLVISTMVSIWFFEFPHYPYDRLIFVSPIPILISYSFSYIQKHFSKNIIIMVCFAMVVVMTISTVTYSTSVKSWISQDSYEKIVVLNQNVSKYSIIPVYPIQTSVGSWIKTINGDYVFYGRISELLDNKTYDYDQYNANYRSKQKLIQDSVYENDNLSKNYTVYIIEGIYNINDYNKTNLEEIYPGIYKLNLI